MGAAPSTLAKLDRVQAAAEKIGGFEAESLQCRREAACVSFSLKLLAGGCKGSLANFIPIVKVIEADDVIAARSRGKLKISGIKPDGYAHAPRVHLTCGLRARPPRD